MNEQERLMKMLELAWIYGNLKCEQNWIEKIPKMTDRELISECTDAGMCVNWE